MPDLTQLGVGGVVAWTILREVFSFLKTRRNGNGVRRDASAGEKSVEFWREQQTMSISAALRDSVVPILSTQTTLLIEVKNIQAKSVAIEEHLERLVERLVTPRS